jgi:hypothetical protein
LVRLSWSRTDDRDEWDDFVVKNRGSIYHSWAWRMALESRGGRPSYMSCSDSKGDLVAVCPFFYGKVRRGFYFLDSLPEGHMTGPLISTEATNAKEILETLTRSVKFSIFDPIVSMMLRVHQQPIASFLVDQGFPYEVSGLFILDLQRKTTADIWVEEFQEEERSDVEYFEKGGSSFELGHQESDYDRFLTILHESQRHQGYDPLSEHFLSSLRSNFGEKFKIAMVSSRNDTVASLGFLCDTSNSTIHWVYVGYSRVKSKRSYRPPLTYVFAGWMLVNWAAKNGFRYVDFGPTSPDPANPRHRMKKKFGGEWINRYEIRVPIRGGFTFPIYMKSRSLARSIINITKRSSQ